MGGGGGGWDTIRVHVDSGYRTVGNFSWVLLFMEIPKN